MGTFLMFPVGSFVVKLKILTITIEYGWYNFDIFCLPRKSLK
jgi:hypothetical protein